METAGRQTSEGYALSPAIERFHYGADGDRLTDLQAIDLTVSEVANLLEVAGAALLALQYGNKGSDGVGVSAGVIISNAASTLFDVSSALETLESRDEFRTD